MANLFKRRHSIQALGALAFNGNLKGFFQGKIYSGAGKSVCLPVLNCYSCPGAVGACPIGSMQAVLGSPLKSFSYYVTGMLLLFGIIMGRFICGFLCPFGFFQDLLYKIPTPKKNIKGKIHHILKYGKYVTLILFVIVFPLAFKSDLGLSDPYFCKFICPAGTLEAGLPLILTNPVLRGALGIIFTWKLSLSIFIIVAATVCYRFFCKYLCPLGAVYGMCNPISFLSMKVDKNRCIKCRKCVRECKMVIEPYLDQNSPECIRCGDCVKICPTKALKIDFSKKK